MTPPRLPSRLAAALALLTSLGAVACDDATSPAVGLSADGACAGPAPGAAAVSEAFPLVADHPYASEVSLEAVGDCAAAPGTCLGEPPPDFALPDIQPLSCGTGQTYGLDAFEGKPTLVALLAGWCGYCQSQSQQLEALRAELALEGFDAHMVTVNAATATSSEHQQKLIERCSFPILQDTDATDIWTLMGGKKDWMYVYRADGTLSDVLPQGDPERPITLTDETGRANVKSAILAAFE